MNRKYEPITLTDEEYAEIERTIHTGIHSARTIKRAQVLLRLHEQALTSDAIAEECGYTPATIFLIAKRYRQGGLSTALYDAPRPGQPLKFSPEDAARITAIACSEAPAGRTRWTLRLLAERLVELDICDSVAPETINTILKKTN
jgi:putative transposase